MADASSTKRRTKAEVPFYESAPDSSAAVIAEARRAQVRSLRTQRPFTPANRRLFDRRAAGPLRPPSAVSISAELAEEVLVRPATRGGALPPLDRRPSLPSVLGNSAARSGLHVTGSAATPQNSAVDLSSVGNARPLSASVQPSASPIVPRPPAGPPPSSAGRRRVRPSSQKGADASSSTSSKAPVGSNSTVRPEGVERGNDTTAPGHTAERPSSGSHKRAARSSSASQVEGGHRNQASPDNLSKDWLDILALVKEINAARQESLVDMDSLCERCKALHQLLKAAKGKSEVQAEISHGRKAVLTAIFRLLPMKHPPVVICASKIAFQLHVSGSNLFNLIKSLFAIARKSENDAEFADEDLLAHLSNVMLSREFDTTPKNAIIYAGGVLKLVSTNEKVCQILVRQGLLSQLTRLLRASSQLMAEVSRRPDVTEDDVIHMGSVLVQATGILRSLAEFDEHHPVFLKDHVCQLLFPCLHLWFHEKELLFNTVRIYSCLTRDPQFQDDIISMDKSCGREFLQLLHKSLAMSPPDNDLIVRTWFILGNLAEDSEAFRQASLSDAATMKEMAMLLSAMADKVFQRQGQDMEGSTHPEDDMLVKALRVLVNLSLSSRVGAAIASSEEIVTAVLRIFDLDRLASSSNLLEALLTLVGNLSYYACTASHLLPKQVQVLTMLIPYITSADTAIATDAIHILSNLTRSQVIRNFIFDKNLEQHLVSLMSVPHPELIHVLCGTLINISGDPSLRGRLKSTNAVEQLINVIKFYGPSDWELATLSCKVLWNYCQDVSSDTALMTADDISSLVEILTSYLAERPTFSDPLCNGEQDTLEKDEEAEAELQQLWLQSFVPVADLLLEFISANFNCLEPI